MSYLSVNAGVSVLQPRHALIGRTAAPFFSPGAGVRLGDGDPVARRAAAAVPLVGYMLVLAGG